MTLTEFLTARLDEDETVARRCHVETALPVAWQHLVDGGQVALDHIARHDPARVLAEVDAKRQIVSLAWHHFGDESFAAGMEAAQEAALRLLALPYADHPDYREEWRP